MMKRNSYVVAVMMLLVSCVFLSAKAQAYPAELSQAMDLTYNAKFEEAERILNAYVSANPQDPMGYLIRGTTWDWKQLVRGLHGSLNEKILADYEQGNKLAFLIWEKDPENIDKMINLGNSYMFLSKKWIDLGKKPRAGLILKKCQKHMEEAFKRDPSRFDAYMANGIFNFYAANVPPGLSGILSLLGISGDEQVGLEQVRKTATNPNLYQNHAAFVLSYMYGQTKKNYTAALPLIAQLRSKFPQNPYFAFLGGEYATRAKQYDRASKDFADFESLCASQACSQNHKYLTNYYMALGLIEQGRPAEAAPYVAKMESLYETRYPERASQVALFKGQVLKAQGKKSEAKTYFQKAIDTPEGNANDKKAAQQELSSL